MLTLRQRGANKVWYVRGIVSVGPDKVVVKEQSTGCSKRSAAVEVQAKIERDVRRDLLDGPGRRILLATVAEAALDYLGKPGGLNRTDVMRVGKLVDVAGDTQIRDVLTAWNIFVPVAMVGNKPATVERYRAVLQAMINHYCRGRGVVAPKIATIKFKNQRIRFLNSETRDLLISCYSKHVQPIATVLAFQGSRTQEVLQMRWEVNVDLSSGTLFFDRTKSGDPRGVPMHSRVKEVLLRVWEDAGRPRTGHVFLNRIGKPYADTREYKLPGGNPLRASHKAACAKAGVTDFRVHDWRHCWASQCVMAGVDLPTLQRLGGWKTLRMVERYAAVADH